MKRFTTSLKLSIRLQFCNLFFQNAHDHFVELQFNLICRLKKVSERAKNYWSLSAEYLQCSVR